MDVSITCLSTNSSCISTHISSCLLNILSTTSAGNCSIDIRNSSLSNVMEVEMKITEHLSQGYHYMITVTLRTTSPVVPSMMSTINLSMELWDTDLSTEKYNFILLIASI